MSAILAVCGDTFCAMVSDGRYVEEPITGEKPHILKNDLPKVRKINRNVVVGFAGDTLAAVQIINAVDEYQTQYLTATSRRPRPPARVPTSSRVPAPTQTWPPGSRRRSSRRPPTGTAWTMWPIRCTAALPRWPSSTRASTPRISVSL